MIIDDGGHYNEEQIVAFEALFDALQPHGVHFVEDTHTSYQGGRSEGTFIAFAKQLVDSANAFGARLSCAFGV